MNGTFVIFLVYLLLEFVIITSFILDSLTLPSVREVSPLNFELFEAELTHYPDRVKANFVLQGIKEGFKLGCDKPVILKSARRNKLSAYQHSSVIDTDLPNEVRVGCVAGPFDTPNIMHLLRSLLKAAACFSFTFAAIHVPGRNNGIADALSGFNFQAFHTRAPQAKKSPILIPVQLLAQLSILV